nr:MAG TPA_asm: hypothetical protein [Caudoviricetes sp.]
MTMKANFKKNYTIEELINLVKQQSSYALSCLENGDEFGAKQFAEIARDGFRFIMICLAEEANMWLETYDWLRKETLYDKVEYLLF